MSSGTLADSGTRGTSRAKLWLGIILLIAAGVGLAWLGAGNLGPQTVQVETLTEGSGPKLKPVDGAYVEYEGRLPDGTVFDSSASHGGPQPMIAGQVIPGFAEALSQMQKGGRYTVVIPSDQAYGATPPPGSPIPPNSDLEFDVHIVDVVPNAALMTGPPPSAQPQQAPPGGQAPPQPQ